MASENGDLRLLEPSSDCFISEPLSQDIYSEEQTGLVTEFQNFVEPVCEALQMSYCVSNDFEFEPMNVFEEVAEDEDAIWNVGRVDDVMWSITKDQSAYEPYESFPPTRSNSPENICASVLREEDDELVAQYETSKRLEKRDDPMTYCTIICQDWINEFAIPSDPEPAAKVFEGSLDPKLLNFLANKRGTKGRHLQSSKGRKSFKGQIYYYPESVESSSVDFEEDTDYMQIDDKDPYEEELALTTNQSLLPAAEREFQDFDDGSQDYNDYENPMLFAENENTVRFAENAESHRRTRIVHDYSNMQRYSNGDISSSYKHCKRDSYDGDDILGSRYAQTTPSAPTINRKKIRLQSKSLISSLNKVKYKKELPDFSFETPPSTPCEWDSLCESSVTIEAFQPRGSGVGAQRLMLGHYPGPPSGFSCRTCPDEFKAETLNTLAKHIEKYHSPEVLFCLLCKSDEKGNCPSFETTTAAFVHAMENHNTCDGRYFLCAFCQHLVMGLENLQTHLAQKHWNQRVTDPLIKMRRFPCLLCLFPFKNSGHRVDHYKQNHKMNIDAFHRRTNKKGGNKISSPKHEVYEKPPKAHEVLQRRLNKSIRGPYKINDSLPEEKINASQEKKLAKLEKKRTREERLNQISQRMDEQLKQIGSDSESVASSSHSSVRRTCLRTELKDKYAEILQNPPKVVLKDITDEFYKGHYEYYTWKYFENCKKDPKIKLEKNQLPQKVIIPISRK